MFATRNTNCEYPSAFDGVTIPGPIEINAIDSEIMGNPHPYYNFDNSGQVYSFHGGACHDLYVDGSIKFISTSAAIRIIAAGAIRISAAGATRNGAEMNVQANSRLPRILN